jgi:hypothetical protein
VNENPIRFTARVGETKTFLARLRHKSSGEWADGNNTSTIAVSIKNQAGTAIVDGESLTPADVLKSQHITDDPRWNDDWHGDGVFDDEPGYNFEWTTDADAFPSPGWYVVLLTLTNSDSEVSSYRFEGTAVR